MMPEFELVADREGECVFVTPTHWTVDGDAITTVGPVLDRRAQQSLGYGEYGGPNPQPTNPPEWPFGRLSG